MKKTIAIIIAAILTASAAAPVYAAASYPYPLPDSYTGQTNYSYPYPMPDSGSSQTGYPVPVPSPIVPVYPIVPGKGPTNTTGPGSTYGTWYRDPVTLRYWFGFVDGHKPRNQWEKISGKWYWFDNDGFIVQNKWVQIAGKWYCFAEDGSMYAGCMTPDKHFVDSTGALVEFPNGKNPEIPEWKSPQ